jgi:hypothetical protein
MSAQDERKAVTQAYAILLSLGGGATPRSGMAVTLRDAARQITTAMARTTSGEAALNDVRDDAATALSAVTELLETQTLTQEAIGGAERAVVALLHAFDREDKQPERIYVDPTLPAILQHDSESHEYHTLEEAVLAWLRLPQDERAHASIKVNVANGPIYTAADIDRLHIGAEHQHG